MALAEEARITSQSDGKIFIFRGVSAKPKKTQPVIPFPFISTSAASTFLFRFFGQQEFITIGFAIVDDGTDVSSGTGGSAITSVQAQIDFLQNDIYTAAFDDLWDFTMASVYSSAISGVITDIEFDVPIGRPSIRTGTLTLQRGRLVPL